MPKFTQSGTGATLTADQIKAGSFSPDTFFIETGTGRKITQKDLLNPSPIDPFTKDGAQQISQIAGQELASIPTPTPAPSPTSATPSLPTPQAPQVHDSFVTGIDANAKAARTALEDRLKTEQADIDRRREAAKAELDRLNEQSEAILEQDVEPLLQPFREDLENAERDRLHINKNFQANQKLVDELETLFTEANQLIQQKSQRFAPRASIAASVNKTLTDVEARAGVIQAVINARNGQIAQAETMIDRSVAAITADRKDQLTYYQAILDLNEKKAGREETKILNLDKEKRDFIKAEIGLLETDLARAESYADNIKSAMLDPDLALTYAEAGVKLTDSPDEVNKKLSEYGFQREKIERSNEMAANGFTFLAP